MKKLLFYFIAIASICTFSLTSKAQVTMTASQTTFNASNTGTFTYRIPATYGAISMQVVVAKTSGTVAGTVLARGSLDGVNYVDISTDTFNLVNTTTNSHIWKFDKTYYLYYQLSMATTSSTQVVTASAKLLGRL